MLPLLRVDSRHSTSAAPILGGKCKQATAFECLYTVYEWTTGNDVTTTERTSNRITLSCTTTHTTTAATTVRPCSYSLQATFNSSQSVHPFTYWQITTLIHHNHAPHYLPISTSHPAILAENESRQNGHGNPHFRPPFIVAPFHSFTDFLYATSPALPPYLPIFQAVGINADDDPTMLRDFTSNDIISLCGNQIPPFQMAEFLLGVGRVFERVEAVKEGDETAKRKAIKGTNEDWKGPDGAMKATVLLNRLLDRGRQLRLDQVAEQEAAKH